MDKIELGKEQNDDVTRESLIALSYGVPDNGPTAEISPKNTDNEEKVVEHDLINHDGLDIYRSKLISISYSPPSSPDVKANTPPSPGQLDG